MNVRKTMAAVNMIALTLWGATDVHAEQDSSSKRTDIAAREAR